MVEHGRTGPTTAEHLGRRQRQAVAVGLAEAPGTYAVLLGSGISSGAGLPTAWEVVLDLIRKVAASDGIELDPSDAERWWGDRTGSRPRYDTVLSEIAPTDGMRQRLLAPYFSPTAEAGATARAPSDAHRKLAWLARNGAIRVILTTNFDRLMELAMIEAGVHAQVISRDTDVRGMVPLQHAPVTLVKLHGDYTMLGMRNSELELARYPLLLRRLLSRILDEYGLIVLGWSATWDPALRAAIGATANRRYPTFWCQRGRPDPEARLLIEGRQFRMIPIESANELLNDLTERVDAVRALAAAPAPVVRTQDSRHILHARTLVPGWIRQPLLQIRVAATWSTSSAVPYFRAPERDAVLDALPRGRAEAHARDVEATLGPRGSVKMHPASGALAGASWVRTPGQRQTSTSMSYRLGSDGDHGVSLALRILGPTPPAGFEINTILDYGISVAQKLTVAHLTTAVRDLGTTLLIELPTALSGLLRTSGTVLVEGYVEALDGVQHPSIGSALMARPNHLPDRVDLSPLGEPPDVEVQRLAFSVRVEPHLTPRDVTELSIVAIEDMAYGAGWTDPREAISALRTELTL